MRNLSGIVKFSTKLDFIILFMCNFIHLSNRKAVIPLGLRAMPGSTLTSTKCIIYLIQAQKLHLNCIIEPAGIRVIYVRFFHSCHSETVADHRPSSPIALLPIITQHCPAISNFMRLQSYVLTCLFLYNMFKMLQNTTTTP